jgi:flagellar FliL protein
LALLILGGGGAFMLGLLDPLFGIEREKTKLEIDLGVPVRHPLPVIKADLKTGRCRSPFLRVEVVVQVNKNDVDLLIDNETAIVDRVRSHLREQERQDLVGKAGTDKLRFDLVNIINQVIAPARVHGILFKDFLLQ